MSRFGADITIIGTAFQPSTMFPQATSLCIQEHTTQVLQYLKVIYAYLDEIFHGLERLWDDGADDALLGLSDEIWMAGNTRARRDASESWYFRAPCPRSRSLRMENQVTYQIEMTKEI